MQQDEYIGAFQYYIEIVVHIGGLDGSGCLLTGW